MVDIKFVDAENDCVDVTSFDDDGVPVEVEKIVIDRPSGDWSDLASLTNMMNQTERKVDQITLGKVTRLSPAFLAFFISLSNKTFKLRLHCCWLSEALLGCLMGSIMNGLKGLEIENWSNRAQLIPSRYQTRLLFEAVASSSSLELLDITAVIGLEGEVCSSLLRALKQNNSLRSLQLYVDRVSSHQQLLRTVFWETELHTLVLASIEPNRKLVPLSTLMEGLCREDCKLVLLDLTFDFKIDVDLNDIIIHNTSLVEMHLRYTNVTCYQAVKIAKTCKSLRILNISHNPISDLAPLDDILLGEAAILKQLLLNNNGISEEKWIEFFEKIIPRMKSLERLTMANEPFINYSDSFRAALLDGLWQNTTLESVGIYDDYDRSAIELHEEEFFQNESIPLCLNRAGRKAFLDLPSETLPKALWPLLLERAMTLKYFSVGDKWHSPSLTSTRTDAVYYWFLREHMLVLSLTNSNWSGCTVMKAYKSRYNFFLQ